MDGIALNDDERKVLEVLGKLHISKNKNVYEATIRKKLPQKYQAIYLKPSRVCIARDF